MEKIIQIIDKRHCSGCLSCMNECPIEAIGVHFDREGFFYPKVDERKCIHCGRCEKVCPYRREGHGTLTENKQSNIKYYAAQLKNNQDLLQVSSGGAFWALAQAILEVNGVVYGAAQVKVGKVQHIRATTIAEAEKIRRSKYLQSDIGWCYRSVRNDLELGVSVLFSGTGCQVAGLYGFLKKKYSNLYTCEVVCHGVPSAKIWDIYQKEKEISVGSSMESVVFRDKSQGWSRNQYEIVYKNGLIEKEFSIKHAFHAGYLQGLFYRPSCGVCPFAKLPRIADITLADYWRYQGLLRPKGEDLGVSLVVVNNCQGEMLLRKAGKFLKVELADEQNAISSCRHLSHIPSENQKREVFIDTVLEEGYHVAAERYIHMSLWRRLKNKIKRILEMDKS